MEFCARDHAWLYGVLAQEIRRERPEDFPAILQAAVEAYGAQRGSRMGQAADACGFPRSMLTYLSCGEWTAAPGESSLEIAGTDPIVWHVTACPWQAEWAREGMTDVGRYYCRSVDRALVHGFNPELELTIGEEMTAGDGYCYFRWNGAAQTDETRRQMEAMAEESRPLRLKSWVYHMGHLYKTMGEVLEEKAGSDIRRSVYSVADSRIEARFGHEAVELLHAGLALDYGVNPTPDAASQLGKFF